MNSLLAIFRTKPHKFAGCTPLSAAERMARYSPAHAEQMRARANAGAALPKVRQLGGNIVFMALPGRVNALPKKGSH